MTRGKKKEVYSVTELENLKAEKQEREEQIKFIETNPGSVAAQTIDRSRLKKEAEYFDRQVREHSPDKVAGTSKDRLAQEAQQLRDQLQRNMCTKHEMDFPADHPGCIQKHVKWVKENDLKVRRYKEVMRHLEPDDPTAIDIEKLRREK